MSRNCEHIPEDILADLARARALHDRVYADFAQCNEFSRLMSDPVWRMRNAGPLPTGSWLCCWTATPSRARIATKFARSASGWRY